MSSFSDEEIRFGLLRKYSANQWGRYPKDIIPLTAADPDFRAAQPIRQAIIKMAIDGVFSYGADGGNTGFKEACARHITKRKGYRCEPEEIHALNGVAQGMMLTCKTLLKPGDEAIIFDPVDFLFGKSIDAAGGKKVLSKVDWETLEFDLEGLKELVTPRTRMLCICNPHNPYGRVLRKDELKAMVDLAEDHELWIMSDEIWSDIVYDGRKHIPTASLEGARERTISLYGFSKTFAVAGLQLGFIVAQNPELMKRFKETGNPTAVFQRHIRMEQRRRFFGVFKIADQFGFARLKNRHLFFHRRRVETIHYGLHQLLYLALDLRHFGTFRDDVA